MNALPFSIVPAEMWLDDRLTKNQLRVLGALFSFRGRDTGICWPSREALSRRCGLAVDRISRVTTELVGLGWLEKVRRFDGLGSTCEYRITVPEIVGNSDAIPAVEGHPASSKADRSNAGGPVRNGQPDLSESDSQTCQVSTGLLKGREQTKNRPGTDQNPTAREGAREDLPLQDDLPAWIPADVWTAFIDHRKAIKHPLTKRALTFAISRLSKLRDQGNDPVEVIEQSILNDWRGFFPVAARGGKHARRYDPHAGIDFPTF